MRIHLIGICGTGMGSLAGLLAEAGHQVSGSDQNVYPPVSTMLAARKIPILEGYRPQNLSGPDGPPDLVVVGNIVSSTNPEVEAMLASGIEHVSMPQALARFFLEGRHPVVVAGTHGKTTTTALMASVLLAAGRDPSFLVGGVMKGLDASFRLGSGAAFVIEGDEYETSFFDKGPKMLHYRPRTAILTSVEYDHAEMYPSLDAVKEAFARFVALVPPAASGGTLVVCADDPAALALADECRGKVIPYGLSPGARMTGRGLESGPWGMRFRATDAGEDLGEFRMTLTGSHNLRNALSVVAVARTLGLTADQIRSGLASFQGVKRRQEVRGEVAGVTVLDDFAHHPTAVRETIAATGARFPGRRLWAIFEPRTNTTRRDVFQAEYARSFDGADEVIVAPVDHPERAPEGHRFDPARLVAELQARGLAAAYAAGGVDEIIEMMTRRARRGDVVLVMSNGGFGGLHDRLLSTLGERGVTEAAG